MANATTSPATQGGLTPAATTPRGSGSVDDNRCRGVRGDNPYRRKWNPRLAAAHRRDVECSEKRRREELNPPQEISNRITLADYLNVEAEQAEEADAAAAAAEAAQAEAQATALAEIAAAANFADQSFLRQQDSAPIPAP